MSEYHFRLPRGQDGTAVLQALGQNYKLVAVDKEVSTRQYLDSFDWRLFQGDFALVYDGRHLYLKQLVEPGEVTRLRIDKRPSFIWEFAPGALHDQLAPILETRALLVQVEVQTQTIFYNLLDKEEKTVLQLGVEETRPLPLSESPFLLTHLQLMPEREDDNNVQVVLDLIADIAGMAVNPVDHRATYFEVMYWHEKAPGGYNAKPRLLLQSHMRADEATKKLLRSDLEIMKINEPYIAQEIDTEFLHDYRVALRRSRVLLAQMKGVFPEAATLKFKADLKWISQQTNQLRDLDVYLLAEGHYRGLLPDNRQPDIAPLFAYLQQKRTAVFIETINILQSERYVKILADWSTFLNTKTEDDDTAPNAGRAIQAVASERIVKRYHHILEYGRQIIITDDKAQMHKLRLECKKLRYLMEFFISLYPAEEISLLIKQLKTLQTNLGDFNDLRVQESYLLEIAEELAAEGEASPGTVLAMGDLIGKIHEGQLTIKAEFADTFNSFSREENHSVFEALFNAD